jgi:hypothetical protein
MYLIVTNNQLCLRKYGSQIKVEYLEDGSYMDVLLKVRDYLHLGWIGNASDDRKLKTQSDSF